MNMEKRLSFLSALLKKIPNTHKHHAAGQRQAIITSAGTKRGLLIGVKTHTLTCVMGIR